MSIQYQAGYKNHFSTEAQSGALPKNQNSPQISPQGLYAEQLSGTAFTAPRDHNLKSWLYKLYPSVVHSDYAPYEGPKLFESGPFNKIHASPKQLRWDPLSAPTSSVGFLESLITVAGNGSPQIQDGSAIHLYCFNDTQKHRYFYNADGDLLFVPQEGTLSLHTEMGILEVEPLEIAVIPKGIKFRVDKKSGAFCRGYVLENYGQPFRLPELGPIGANGLANPRHFLAPTAHYEHQTASFEIVAKFQGQLWKTQSQHSPLNVVAWSGNYYPYKYDLRLFNTIGTVSFDHPDPSIFTVLSSPSALAGTSNIDFAIFPPRWMVALDTFRPPYFHRNTMSEYMGLITGEYDAKADGFTPGGGSLHNCMSGHGPDVQTFQNASKAKLEPQYQDKTMAFMFESRYVYCPTQWAMSSPQLQKNYISCWQNFTSTFAPNK